MNKRQAKMEALRIASQVLRGLEPMVMGQWDNWDDVVRVEAELGKLADGFYRRYWRLAERDANKIIPGRE